jgi:hypothetical protein
MPLAAFILVVLLCPLCVVPSVTADIGTAVMVENERPLITDLSLTPSSLDRCPSSYSSMASFVVIINDPNGCMDIVENGAVEYKLSFLNGTNMTDVPSFGPDYRPFLAATCREADAIYSVPLSLSVQDPSTTSEESSYLLAVKADDGQYYATMRNLSFSSTVRSSCDNSSGGGECKTVWTCGPWSACKNGRQTRTCVKSSHCNDRVPKPETNRACVLDESIVPPQDTTDPVEESPRGIAPTPPQALFDISLELLNTPRPRHDLDVRISLINFGAGSGVTATITTVITTSSGGEVYRETEDFIVDAQQEILKRIPLPALPPGDYHIRMDLTYPGQQEPASAQQPFTIVAETFSSFLLILLLILGGLVALIAASSLLRGSRRKKALSQGFPASSPQQDALKPALPGVETEQHVLEIVDVVDKQTQGQARLH